VGTLPLAWMGRDPEAFLEGGRAVVAEAREGTGLWGSRIGAMTESLVEGYLEGISQWVLMPYALRLETLSAWWAQLVAESLGKQAADGTRRGLTPIRAVGPIDQHSQLQLFMDGPHDHYLTIMRVASEGVGPKVDPELARIAGADMLGGYTVGDIVSAQSHALPEALARAGRPVRSGCARPAGRGE